MSGKVLNLHEEKEMVDIVKCEIEVGLNHMDIVYPPASAFHNILMTLQMSFQSSYFHQLTRGSFPKISNTVGMFFSEWQMMKIITIRIEIRASFCSRFLKTDSVLLLRV